MRIFAIAIALTLAACGPHQPVATATPAEQVAWTQWAAPMTPEEERQGYEAAVAQAAADNKAEAFCRYQQQMVVATYPGITPSQVAAKSVAIVGAYNACMEYYTRTGSLPGM